MSLSVQSDEHFMKQAFLEAQKAYEADEVPVGAVVVCKGRIIARAHNLTQRLNDVTAHAEMQVITSAADYLGGKFLKGCSLFVTLEPCVMCAGAIAWARPDRLVFGAYDAKKGFTLVSDDILHPKTKVAHGVMQKECAQLMTSFFEAKRTLG